ncbi:FAD:protein FMN transferase [Sphingomonas sp. 7/4-4]|uniref:FAD:protein FMN transferase n=1 Tax=Sphingomonas sp. 7/4-4 TaxID=3018446 RepID=UPI0022F3936F|nr:FAD:protein FMN transferase [Sphingomonas sp. 7/4-4]WBY07618.1 FAD:protein FMN transferase [Sphingomonas sp. 7/4-4]
MHAERFAAMGTRVELHLFGTVERAAIDAARRAIEAVDDALTIHRPSATTALNDCLMAGRPCHVDDPLLLDALIEIETAHALTQGLFDPAADAARPGAGWGAVRFDRSAARIAASQPVAFDFGGFGKGFALDRACDALRDAGVTSAFLCAGESSIAVIGEHPLGEAGRSPYPIRSRPSAFWWNSSCVTRRSRSRRRWVRGRVRPGARL